MSEYKHIKELLLSDATGTEGSLLLAKKIHSVLIDEVEKSLIPRSEACLYFGPADIPGSSIDVNLLVANSMDVRLVAEGTEIPLDSAEYTSFNMKPAKYGVSVRITRELLEDAQWNLHDHNVKLAGRRLAENENSLVITGALDNATNTVSGGAAVTIANITRAIQYLEDTDFHPTTYFVGMEVANDLRNIDTFVEFEKVGNRDMLERGFLGTIYGMNVIKVSTNAGMTTTSSYVTDKSYAYAIAEKRPVTVENFELASHDMSASAVTQRITARHVRADAIAKVTSS